MNEVELLNWARGPGLVGASFIMVFGIILRLFEIFSLGKAKEYAEVRSSGAMGGIKTIIQRSIPEPRYWRYIGAAYLFHVGLFVVIFFFMPHILMFESVLGFSWPALPNFIIDIFSVLTIGGMIYTLMSRFTNPSRRIMTVFSDYLVWAVTFLPVITGYMTFHRFVGDYTCMLAIHILSVELLMIVLPFSKLSHSFSFAISRWYTGSAFGKRGTL